MSFSVAVSTGGLVCVVLEYNIYRFYLCTSECLKVLFVGGADRLPRSPYLQFSKLRMEESLLHFQIKIGVVVCFSLLLSAYSCIPSLCATVYSMYMYLQSQHCISTR